MDQQVIDFFHQAWGSFRDGRSPPIFPGPQPISIERRHFQILKNGEYVVCEKTDGVRHALVCLTIDGKKVTALINRALDIRYVKLQMPKSAHNGTILDGELVDNNLLMVYDAVMVSGESVMELDLLGRLGKAAMFIKGIMRMTKDPITVKLKTFMDAKCITQFYAEVIPKLPYETDGLVFTPVNEPVRIGTHETMFKWKPRDLNTIDFQVKWHRDRWCLYIQDRGILVFESEIRNAEPFKDLLKEDAIVECQYMIDDKPIWWKPVGVRTDKKHPNNRRTFYRTMVNVRENIQWEEFASMYKSSKG